MIGQPYSSMAELRQSQRHACEVQTTCQPPSAWCKDPWPATIRDISTGGVSLRLARRFERGSGLAIELPTEDGGTTTVLARISHVEAGNGGWVLGCTFISELSDEEVKVVLNLDPLHQASLHDSETVGAETPSINGVLFQARLNGEVLRWFVRKLDLSSSWPVPEGKTLSFRVAADLPPVEMRIKKCRLIGTYWIVDCKFPGGLPDAVARALAGTAPAA